MGTAHYLGQCSVAARDACEGPAVSLTRSAQRAACGVCESVAFANQTQHASSSAEEPMLSRHRSMPCQCNTCTAGRSDLHIGEVDEYGDNVQRHDTDRGKGTTRGERKKLK